MTPAEELAWRLGCAAQGEMGAFDPDHDYGWTARLLREAATFIAAQAQAERVRQRLDAAMAAPLPKP